MSRRNFLTRSGALTSLLAAGALGVQPVLAQPRKLRFGVGPFMPTAEDTRKAFLPLFSYISKALGASDFELAVSTDWAGLAVAMGSGQLDAAWMGPWGYVIANSATDCQAIATVKYDDKPTYHAIIVGRPDLALSRFPDGTQGRSISFADVGSTSGWLIPTFYARKIWGIDPKTFWKYHEGASHPANEVAVASGQVDLATDYDRNRNAMIAAGRIKPDATRIVWTSDPLPNDAFAVPKGASREFVQRLQAALLGLSGEEAKAVMPSRYTGFVAASHASYKMIEDAGVAVGRLKSRV